MRNVWQVLNKHCTTECVSRRRSRRWLGFMRFVYIYACQNSAAIHTSLINRTEFRREPRPSILIIRVCTVAAARAWQKRFVEQTAVLQHSVLVCACVCGGARYTLYLRDTSGKYRIWFRKMRPRADAANDYVIVVGRNNDNFRVVVVRPNNPAKTTTAWKSRKPFGRKSVRGRKMRIYIYKYIYT